jgi:glycosyltransferase involved in cell wall biosynthesis
MKKNLTLLLLTHNEEENIKNNFTWLDKCKTINEIIVVDDNSTDNTKKEIEKLNSKSRSVKFFNRELNGDFASQRNFGVLKAKNDYIFCLDADEKPSQKLITYLNNIDKHQYKSVSFLREDVFLGKILNHGETTKIRFTRLFNKKYGKFIGQVHEIWQSSKITTKTDLIMYHYSHQSLKKFIQKINFYTDIRAKELYNQKVHVSLFHIIFYPVGKFIQNYFLRLGFLDSTQGIIMALGMSFHSFLVRAKLWHLYQE